eukprot:6187613-Pleurochrysis_carterae.AAC.6
MRKVVRHVVVTMKTLSLARRAAWLRSARCLARSRGVGLCLRGWGDWRERSLIDGTRTPKSSVGRLRGAPEPVVNRQLSGSNLRGVAS